MPSIVITSIHGPTAAVRGFSRLEGMQTFVIGDLPSPEIYDAPGVSYWSVDAQSRLPYRLPSRLPFRHYSRKMIGYLLAIESGADLIIDTDDDNLPEPDYGFPPHAGEFKSTLCDQGFVNVYELFTESRIWPRGLPLRMIGTQTFKSRNFDRREHRVGVWQGLANGDPDVDAIYRLTAGSLCDFSDSEAIVLAEGTLSPYNSQNTQYCREVFPLLYLPATVTFRFTDILRGYVAQPVMWAAGYSLGVTKATVRQLRNPHDAFADFVDEIPMYTQVEKVVSLCRSAVTTKATISENLRQCYDLLSREGIVTPEEVGLVDAWLADLSTAGCCS